MEKHRDCLGFELRGTRLRVLENRSRNGAARCSPTNCQHASTERVPSSRLLARFAGKGRKAAPEKPHLSHAQKPAGGRFLHLIPENPHLKRARARAGQKKSPAKSRARTGPGEFRVTPDRVDFSPTARRDDGSSRGTTAFGRLQLDEPRSIVRKPRRIRASRSLCARRRIRRPRGISAISTACALQNENGRSHPRSARARFAARLAV